MPVALLGSGRCTVMGTSTFSNFPSPSGASSPQMDRRNGSAAFIVSAQAVMAKNKVVIFIETDEASEWRAISGFCFFTCISPINYLLHVLHQASDGSVAWIELHSSRDECLCVFG